MPKVYNKYHRDSPANAVYVGRPSKWGNPHTIGHCKLCNDFHVRGAAVIAYLQDIQGDYIAGVTQADIKKELKGKDLICFCAPKPCHADVLLEIANEDGD